MTQAIGNGAHRVLGAAVHRSTGAEYFDAGDRRNVDEVTACLLFEKRQCGRDAIQYALDVDIDHTIPLVGAQLRNRRDRHQPCVVDHYIDATEYLDCLGNQRRQVLLACHIGRMGNRLAACSGDLRDNRVQTVLAPGAKHHKGAERRQMTRRCFA
ncbi:hypothetical protein D3C76_921150 [compost metagenome]